VGSGWSVGESPVRSAQVPSVTGPWPWPWQRFASSARSSTPRLQGSSNVVAAHGLAIGPAAFVWNRVPWLPQQQRWRRLPPSSTVACRPPPCRSRTVADPLLLCALLASSATGTPRPPGSVAMCRHRRRRRRLSRRHITSAALDVSLSRPGRLTNTPAPT
jgi:hypothetical protein